jgi:hypothetical protein
MEMVRRTPWETDAKNPSSRLHAVAVKGCSKVKTRFLNGT